MRLGTATAPVSSTSCARCVTYPPRDTPRGPRSLRAAYRSTGVWPLNLVRVRVAGSVWGVGLGFGVRAKVRLRVGLRLE